MASQALTDAILLQFSGPDRPGLTADLTAILAASGASILDIGQAVVNETVSLGILVEFVSDTDRQALRAALEDRAQALGLTVTLRDVSRDALTHGLHARSGHQFIVTILGRFITAQHLARVTAILAAHDMNVDRIERLSGNLAGAGSDPTNASFNACVELTVSGDPAQEPSLRAEFLAAAQELSIDIACQRESIYRRNRRLFAFDMDSTLIQAEVIDELAKMAGVGEEVSRITEAAMRGELNFDQSFTRRLSLLRGLPAERVYSLLGTVRLADGAERLIRTLKLLGYKTAILSGGFNFFAQSLKQRLGIDYTYSNDLEIVDGLVTGRVIPPIMNGARKAEMLEEIARREGISLDQAVAVGDGANDIPMMTLAGMGIAYRAKPLVRQKADQSIASLGLDGLLYLIGVRDSDIATHDFGR
jgi:phosphoserine phosphatase